MHRTRHDIADKGGDAADCRVPSPAVRCSVHLGKKSNSHSRADHAAYCRDTRMVDTEREGKISTRHHQEASKPGRAELFDAGTGKWIGEPAEYVSFSFCLAHGCP